jgi:CheY-like chemotaxis protein
VAEDGVQAVERFKEHEGRLGLVLLDLTMPRMDGEQAFHEMHRLNPEVPVVLMSGYSEKLSRDRFAGACPAGFLAKPFNYAALKALLE